MRPCYLRRMERWLHTLGGFVRRIPTLVYGTLVLFSFLLAVLFSCEGVLALFAAYRVHTTGYFHRMPYTAEHDARVAVESFITATLFLWPAYIFRRNRKRERGQSAYKPSNLG